jgi:EAL domain-containing protein (putative c-di-GMP-specific phosphodiesterase class I)
VKRALEDKRDRAIMRSMTGLCLELGIKTVAEMIETEDQAALLQGMGVDYGQGWLFGTPAPELPAAPPKVLPSVTRRTSSSARGGGSATPSPLRRS